ncbi:hypothetical protein SPBR_01548 [Sporothrix brasiliensis 5110]|uniref:Uncharacterized protein n=1 Tax=Sporothrix brasiliensis 5110 TaxID=1398154 RepID=A0A0C2FIT3_9PEZI|nr:uncharacterized protein SPBR_01548 [Sporothrix brasiliensis 5110]KIH91038.1 hypothetical protein SPBR_01548 [Sporothrix brasiliensis 5110]
MASPCRESRERYPSLHLSAIPEEEAPPSPDSHKTAPLSPPLPSPLPPPPIPPPWDRTCDARFSRSGGATVDQTDSWQQAVSQVYSIFGRGSPQQTAEDASPSLLRLPAAVRLRLYQHLVSAPSADRPICLNPQVFTRAVWPRESFDSLATALAPLQGALHASFALRAEVVAAFWHGRRVHVVFSPYVRPAVCPLATLFLQRYVGVMGRSPALTLELDCTRLGYGMHPAAAGLQPGLLSMGALVEGFVEGIISTSMFPLRQLVVLCRRYYGNRPASTTAGDVPYVGPEVEHVAAQLARLAGRVVSARLVGFSPAFTTTMLAILSGTGTYESSSQIDIHKQSPSDAYPLLPGHHAYVDGGRSLGRICLSATQPALSPPIGAQANLGHDDDAKTATSSTRGSQTTSPSPSSSSTSLSLSSSSSSLASTTRTSAVAPRKLTVPSLTRALNVGTRLAVVPRLAPPVASSIQRGSRNRSRPRPPLVALLGLCGTHPRSFVGERLAAAGLAVGVVGSPLQLEGDRVDVVDVVDIIDEKMVGTMDVCAEESGHLSRLEQESGHRLWAGTMSIIGRGRQERQGRQDRQDRSRRRLQKKRHLDAPLVW